MSACVDEYNKNGWVTVDNLQALSQLEPQYLACLEKRDGQMSINTESVQKLAEAEIDLYRVSLLNNTIQGILATTSVEKANQILGQAQSDMSQSKQMLRDAKKQALQEAYEKYGSGDEFYAVRKAINQQIDSWENLDELWLDLKDKDPSTYLSKTSSASKSTSKSVSDAASAFDTLVSAMKEYNQYGYVSANTAKSLAGLEDKYTACLTKQNGKLVLNTEKFKDYIKQQIIAANAADDDGKSAGELNKILDWLNSSVDSETISFEQLTDAIKGYGTAMDEAKEKTDAIKSAFSGLSEVSKNKIENPFGALDKVKETYNNVKGAVSEKIDSAKNWIKDKADKITGKKAAGSRSIGKSGTYNVDEKGPELIVRQPEAGRYTYLETGDGVVPADITSKLFDLGGNPDAWFQKQLAKNGGLTATIQSYDSKPSISISDIYVQKPIGDVDGLAREIVQGLPNAIYQECSKR